MKRDPIDRLFEEKLKDHSEVPDPKVWKAIEASLDSRKKSRKVIPLWWKIGGAAAILLFGLYLLNPLADTPPPGDTITNSREANPETGGNKNTPSGDTDAASQDERPVVAVPDAGEKEPLSGSSRENNGVPIEEAANIAREDALAATGNTNNADAPSDGRKAPAQNLPEVAAVADNAGDNGGNGKIVDKSGDIRDDQASGGIADKGVDKNVPANDAVTGQDNDKAAAVEDAGGEAVADQSGKKSIYDEIAEQETVETADNTPSHWSVGPRVAPVYFNSFGQGSPIHSDFVANSKSGNINLSYGIALSYAISPRLSVRSGVNKVDYGYDTNDISFTPALAVSSNDKINNIDYSLSSRNLIVRNSSEARAAQDALAVEVAALNPERDGRMVQQFGYIEVPLELNYALVDQKLGIHLIGGISSLFLVDNSVTLESDGSSTAMGEANNLNSMNFSTNFGVGIQYELTNRLQLNLEPVFKYQLHTFSDAAGNFNPYSIGVYSGVSFKF